MTCNSGWMHDLDLAAEPIIEACAVLGTARTFDPDEQKALSRWAALVTFLFEQMTEAPTTPPERLAEFRETLEPPQGMVASLAVTNPPDGSFELNAWVNSVQLESASYRGDGHFCTFRIQHLVCRTVIPPAHLNIALHGPEDQFLTPIWPPGPGIDWPPPSVIPPDQLETFARAYIDELR